MTGCGGPPAGAPLLEVSREAVEAEADRLIAEQDRDAEHVEQTRQALAQAYEADLAEAGSLSPAWVREATQVYVLAREQLVRHQMNLEAERRQRARNLRSAAEALRRARDVLQQRDRLWHEIGPDDGWPGLGALLRRGG